MLRGVSPERHLRLSLALAALFLATGLWLEAMIGLRLAGWVDDPLRREFLRLGHAHGGLLALLFGDDRQGPVGFATDLVAQIAIADHADRTDQQRNDDERQRKAQPLGAGAARWFFRSRERVGGSHGRRMLLDTRTGPRM